MPIRRATTADISGIAPLVERYWDFEGIGGFDRARIESLLGRLLSEPERGACWVADADGRLRGFRRRAGYELHDKPLKSDR